MFVYRRRRRIGHDSRCVYIYIFSRIFIFRLPLFAHLNILFLITALWPLLCNRKSNKKRTTTQYVQRAISLRLRFCVKFRLLLNYFSSPHSVEKQPTRASTAGGV